LNASGEPSPLRRLALDYAAGRSDRAAYLQARRQFIETLSAAPPRPAATGAAPDPPERTKPPTAEHRTPGQAAPSRTRRLAWRGLLGAGLALLSAVLFYGLFGGGARTPDPPPADPTAAGAAGETPDAALALVDEFLQEDAWGPSERARFLLEWQRLPPGMQARAREAYAFHHLTAELGALIDAERAAGSGEPTIQGLLDFGRALGMALPEPPRPDGDVEPLPVDRPAETTARP
jgi:hypothetical protein